MNGIISKLNLFRINKTMLKFCIENLFCSVYGTNYSSAPYAVRYIVYLKNPLFNNRQRGVSEIQHIKLEWKCLVNCMFTYRYLNDLVCT